MSVEFGKIKIVLMTAIVAIAASAGVAVADVDEATGKITIDENSPYLDKATGGFRNEVVLYQRKSDRELETAEGMFVVPLAVPIVDTRPVDNWYERKNAKVTFVTKGEKLLRVDISD